jgi:hypothetical protein
MTFSRKTSSTILDSGYTSWIALAGSNSADYEGTSLWRRHPKGGCIYIGIDDECGLSGINDDLQEWSKNDVNDEVVEHYCGALTAKLRDHLIGDIPLWVSRHYR